MGIESEERDLNRIRLRRRLRPAGDEESPSMKQGLGMGETLRFAQSDRITARVTGKEKAMFPETCHSEECNDEESPSVEQGLTAWHKAHGLRLRVGTNRLFTAHGLLLLGLAYQL